MTLLEFVQVVYFFGPAYAANMSTASSRSSTMRLSPPGLLMGVGAGIGDAVKSFLKRQLGISAGSPWLGFDQLDFFLGALACVSLVHVPPLRIVLAVLRIEVEVRNLADRELPTRMGGADRSRQPAGQA